MGERIERDYSTGDTNSFDIFLFAQPTINQFTGPATFKLGTVCSQAMDKLNLSCW